MKLTIILYISIELGLIFKTHPMLPNSKYFSEEFLTKTRHAFDSKQSNEHLNCDTTPTFMLPDFIDSQSAHLVREEILSLNYVKRENDLFSFQQSQDLRSIESGILMKLKQTIYSPEFISTLESLTGIELTGQIDLASQIYEQGDHLLCHDDRMGTRRIAFIYYLVDEDWEVSDGGRLHFMDNIDGFALNKVIKSIVPKFNQICFFPVSDCSFHQVEEVLSSKRRVAIAGWFHGKPLSEKPSIRFNYADQWQAISDYFIENSSVSLENFFADPEHLLSKLENSEWNNQGPAIKCNYDIALNTNILDSTFYSFIRQLSGLDLTSKLVQVRRFRPGSYLMLNDEDKEPLGLDCVINLSVSDEYVNDSGSMFYVDQGETVLKIPVTKNSVSLVLRDEGIERFVKYNSLHSHTFYQISITFGYK